MENLRPNSQRAKNAIALIWIILALEIISFISAYFQYDLLETVANGGIISVETAEANDTREHVIAIAYLIAFVISAITFIQWFRRAYFNLHQCVPISTGEGWAAASWFVPIACLFMPYQIMKELYQETKTFLTKKGLNVDALSTRYLGLWWTLWIINSILGQFVIRYSINANSIDDMTFITLASMVANVVGIPLSFLAIKVIKDYANIEPLLHEIKEEEQTTPEIATVISDL